MKRFVLAVAAFAALVAGSVAQAQTVGTPGYVINQTTSLGSVGLPFTYNYGNSFGAGATFAGGTTSTFYDDITFTVTGSVADSITSTINLGTLLGISGLQARLFSGAGPYSTGGVLDMAWGTTVNYAPGLTGTTVVLAPVTLAAGTYTLEITGTVSGSSGGSYAGVLNVASVPEPEAIALMLAGLALLGAFVSRRRRAAH